MNDQVENSIKNIKKLTGDIPELMVIESYIHILEKTANNLYDFYYDEYCGTSQLKTLSDFMYNLDNEV